MERIYHVDGSSPQGGQVFVFGSNTAGFHAGGAALAASKFHGAMWGVAEGVAGNSYAIPTVSLSDPAGPRPLTVDEIRPEVDRFIQHASNHPNQDFFVTRIGCGIAGHKDDDIAPLFADAPANCSLPRPWQSLLEVFA